MTYVQFIQRTYFNSRKMVSPVYKLNDKVYFNTKHFCNQKLSKKLDHKIYRLYKIIKFVEYYAYKLKFPVHSDVHFVFHVNKLCFALNDLFSGQKRPPLFFLIINNVIEKWEWKIDKILNSKKIGKNQNFIYLIKWKDCQILWQSSVDFTNCAKLLENFHILHLDKSK